jgi:hypothetical protein
MQFVNSRPNNNYYKNNTFVMPYNISYKKQLQSNEQTQVVIPNLQTVNPEKKMKWGEPTWFLFHTLAEKVKDEHFQSIRLELLNTIDIICKNLPCPDCAKHATEYMKKINFASIKTKKDLKLLLFQFHNVVNQKKHFPLFSINDLDTKYSTANTINIIHNFIYHFQDKNHSIRMIANDIYRSRIAEQLKTWFNNNIQYFNV